MSQDPSEAEFHEVLALLFGGLPRLAPGGEAYTRQALALLPRHDLSTVLDLGCGAGAATLVLADALPATIHALDLHAPFLETLRAAADQSGFGARIVTHQRDMAEIAALFSAVDLIWCEGAIYHLGFAAALAAWAPALRPGANVVVSECCWLTDAPPLLARDFWAAAYPQMTTIDQNLAAAGQAGYRCRQHFLLPRDAWTTGYYDHLRPRVAALANHSSPVVRSLVQEIEQELKVFDTAGDSYGYVFFILEHCGG